MNDLIPPAKPVPAPHEPFRLQADERPEIEFRAVDPRDGKRRFFAASGAVLLLTIGFGWAAATHMDSSFQPAPAKPDPVAMAAAEAVKAAKAQGQELASLRVHVEGLRNKLDAQARKSRAEEATIAALQKNMADAKADAAASASQLQARLEKVKSEAEKMAQRKVDRMPTASIGKPPPHATQARAADPGARAPLGPYRAYVLRGAGGGRALIEGPQGMEEVEPGDVLLGGARVENIEHRGANWVVQTDRGFIGAAGVSDD
ncbi:hypothetical protein [Rhodoblastus sp.]|uniref:hypothetical protein n=1 Tax=Rhodoblastus sp. TaxID=1962975 RepID=UPI003F9ACD3D